ERSFDYVLLRQGQYTVARRLPVAERRLEKMGDYRRIFSNPVHEPYRFAGNGPRHLRLTPCGRFEQFQQVSTVSLQSTWCGRTDRKRSRTELRAASLLGHPWVPCLSSMATANPFDVERR